MIAKFQSISDEAQVPKTGDKLVWIGLMQHFQENFARPENDYFESLVTESTNFKNTH